MQPIVVRYSFWRYGIPLIGSLVIVFVCILILGKRDSLIAWVALVVFFVWASASAGFLARGRVQLIIDHDGILDLQRDIGTVRWADMKDVFARREGNRELICFLLRDQDSYRRRLNAVERKLSEVLCTAGCGDFHVNATRLGLNTDEVVDFASRRIAETRRM